jgi:hypothetical protein
MMASYSKLVDRYSVVFAVFFKLNVADVILRKVFSEKNEFKPITPQPRITPTPLTPSPQIPIAEYASMTRVEYNSERFMLLISGPLNEVTEVSMRLPKLFDELDYNLDEMVKYFEIVFPVQPIDVPDATRKIRKLASFRGSEKLSRIVGSDLGVFTVSLSYPETPLTFNWFEITVSPDINAPTKRIIISIIARADNSNKAIELLKNIPEILGVVREVLEEVRL